MAFIEELYPKNRKQYKSKRLELAIDLMKGDYMSDITPYHEPKMEWYEHVIGKSRKIGDNYMEAYVLANMWGSNFYNLRYANCFIYAQRWEEALGKVDDHYPYKSADYFNIGMSYYMFKDYDRALPLFYKALSAKGSCRKPWNYLAAYHQMNGNLDSAAYYHRKILSSREPAFLWGREVRSNDPIHLSIAICNLGRLEMKKENYDAAIAMLEAGYDHIKDHWDNSLKASVHISLGECYLEKGDMATT